MGQRSSEAIPLTCALSTHSVPFDDNLNITIFRMILMIVTIRTESGSICIIKQDCSAGLVASLLVLADQSCSSRHQCAQRFKVSCCTRTKRQEDLTEFHTSRHCSSKLCSYSHSAVATRPYRCKTDAVKKSLCVHPVKII